MHAPTSLHSSSPLEELRASLLELTVACPVDECNPADCPLFLLRKMNPRQRRRWVEALDQADLEYLAAYHQVCMNVRLSCCSFESQS